MKPDVSVIVVADYQVGQEKAWDDLRAALKGLAAQDYDGPVEVVAIEEQRFANAVPPDLAVIVPSLRFVFTDVEMSSYEMKNLGVRDATADLVVLLDGDCTPASGWLSAFVGAMRDNPDVSVASGRTRYPGLTFFERAMGLLSRAYVERGAAAATKHISNNNAGYRREAYLEHPLPTDAGVFAANLQAVDLTHAGHNLYFEPAMDVVHDYSGWELERDSRRYGGHGAVLARLKDRRLPRAWLTDLSYLSIPIMFAGRVLSSWGRSTLYHRHYGVHALQLPLVFVLAVVAHALEIPGMIAAYRGKSVGDTDYR